MSNEERAYMLRTGVPLTDNERTVATEMHMERAAALASVVAKLKAELRTAQSALDGENDCVRRINNDWKDLGPNSTLLISELERKRILRGMPVYDIEVVYSFKPNVTARYIPDETETYAAKPNPR